MKMLDNTRKTFISRAERAQDREACTNYVQTTVKLLDSTFLQRDLIFRAMKGLYSKSISRGLFDSPFSRYSLDKQFINK